MIPTRQALEARGLSLYCPMCRSRSGCVHVNLACPAEFRCAECEEEFTADDVHALIEGAKQWQRAVAWLLTMPDQTPTEENR